MKLFTERSEVLDILFRKNVSHKLAIVLQLILLTLQH
jgi:hypothetical protein